MKFLSVLFVLMSFNSFAQGGGDRVGTAQISVPYLTLDIPSSPMMRNPKSVKVEVFTNGKVLKTVTKRGVNGELSSEYVDLGKVASMSAIYKCSEQLQGLELDPFEGPLCMDAPTVSYKTNYAKQVFAKARCGHLRTVLSVPCAKEMVKLLDGYNFSSK